MNLSENWEGFLIAGFEWEARLESLAEFSVSNIDWMLFPFPKRSGAFWME